YNWEVMNSEDESSMSNASYICLLNDEETEKVMNELGNLSNNIISSSGIVQELVHAQYFENEGLLMNAFECYERAISIMPGLPEANNAYRTFLVKHRLSNKE
ncbi:hypothetical protein ACFLSQ_05070, partial [Bacteroidota bacterium]